MNLWNNAEGQDAQPQSSLTPVNHLCNKTNTEPCSQTIACSRFLSIPLSNSTLKHYLVEYEPERLRSDGWWDSPVSLPETPLSIWRPQLEQTDRTKMNKTDKQTHKQKNQDDATSDEDAGALTWCREVCPSPAGSAGSRGSWGCSSAACADSDWRWAWSESRPCPGTRPADEWRATTWKWRPAAGGCGWVR